MEQNATSTFVELRERPLAYQPLYRCVKCGRRVEPKNDVVARLLLGGKPIICDDCRSGKQWTAAAYRDYLETTHWRETRARAIERAGHKCQVCGARESLDAHHNDYSRLGGELMTDLVVLCRDCHDVFHTHRSLAY